jgi:hypothetical protein
VRLLGREGLIPAEEGNNGIMMRLLTLALVVASVAAASASAVARAPSLKIERATPLVVRGLGFHAREIVTVTTSIGHLRVRTTATGGFVASFRTGTDRCSGGRIVALGTTGDRAVLRLPQLMCAPAAPAAASG